MMMNVIFSTFSHGEGMGEDIGLRLLRWCPVKLIFPVARLVLLRHCVYQFIWLNICPVGTNILITCDNSLASNAHSVRSTN